MCCVFPSNLKIMFQKLIRFFLIISLVIGLIYGLHRLLIASFFSIPNLDFFHFSYKFNVGITLLFTTTIILASEKLKDQVGFVFLAGSFAKIGLFLYLAQNLGFELGKSNFFIFFIPYLGCVLCELFFVIGLLKTIYPNNND